MMKASLALLCLALACTAYAADINVSDLHQQLQAVDPRCGSGEEILVDGSFNDTKRVRSSLQPQGTSQSYYANV